MAVNCTIDHFNKEFDNTLKKDLSAEITNNPRKTDIRKWVNIANKEAASEGFPAALFHIEDQGDNTFVYYSPEVHELYNIFTEKVNKPFLDSLDEESIEQEYENAEKAGLLDDEYHPALVGEGVSESRQDINFSPGNLITDSMDNPLEEMGGTNIKYWIRKRKALLSEFEEFKEKLIKSRDKSGKIKEVNKHIEELEEELDTLEKDGVDTFADIAEKEVKDLEDGFKELYTLEDPREILNSVENNKIFERVRALKNMIAMADGEDGSQIYLYDGIMRALGDSKDSIKSRINDLNNRRDRIISKMVYNMIASSDYIKQRLGLNQQLIDITENDSEIDSEEKQKKLKELYKERDRIEEFVKKLKEQIEGDSPKLDSEKSLEGWVGSMFLTGDSYNSILPNAIAMELEQAENRVLGGNKNAKKDLEDSFEKLRKIKFGNKITFEDAIWDRDEFGSRNGRIVGHLTKDFFKILSRINKRKANFNRTRTFDDRSKFYKQWMKDIKENANVIDLRKIESVKDEFGGREEYGEFFTFEDSEMKEYEKKMIEEMGYSAFQIELKEAKRGLRNFLQDVGYKEQSVKYSTNPMRFIEHFYSEDYTLTHPVTGFFMTPHKFNRISPKNSKEGYGLNKDFLDIENKLKEEGLEEEFSKFYNAQRELDNYSKSIFKMEGIKFNNDYGVLDIEDEYNKEALKQFSLFGKLKVPFVKAGRTFMAPFHEGRLENEEQDKDYNIKRDRKFNIGHSQPISSKINKMAGTIYNKSLEKIKEVAEKEGLNVPLDMWEKAKGIYKAKEGEIVKDSRLALKYKKKIAYAIARKHFSKYRSQNFIERMGRQVAIAESIDTRRSVEGMMKLFKEFSRNTKNDAATSYLEDMEAHDILRVGKLQKSSGEGSFADRVERLGTGKKGDSKGRRLSKAEKELKKMLGEEKRNMDDNALFDFKHDNKHYTSDENGNVSVKDLKTGEIDTSKSLSDIKSIYATYLQEKINNLGSPKLVGRIMLGLPWKIHQAFLTLDVTAGFRNFHQGQATNREMAVEGRYGYDMEAYTVARRFLKGFPLKETMNVIANGNIEKYMNSLAIEGDKKKLKKVKQLLIFKDFMSKLELLDNVATDLGASTEKSNYFTRVSSAFSVDIPEFMNQSVPALGILQNDKLKIKDKNGVWHPFLDPKTGELPYDVSTGRLKKEFRTSENILMWEKMEESKDGRNPSSVFKLLYKRAQKASQGDYSMKLSNKVEMHALGKPMVMFMKWFYKTTHTSWGYNEFDLTGLELKKMGRMRHLISKYPHLFAVNTAFNVFKIPFNIISLVLTKGATYRKDIPEIIEAVTGITLGIHSLVRNAKLKNKDFRDAVDRADRKRKTFLKMQLISKMFQEILGYTAETATRSVITSLQQLTNYRVGPFQKLLDKITRVNNPEYFENHPLGVTTEDRRIASATSQNLANKAALLANSYIAMLGATGAWILIKSLLGSGGDDDDDKKKQKETEESLYHINNTIRYMINIRNGLMQDFTVTSNPSQVFTTIKGNPFLGVAYRSYADLAKQRKKYKKGEIGLGVLATEYLSKASIFLGVPQQFTKVDMFVNNTYEDFIQDDWIYDKDRNSELDQLILDLNRTPEEVAKRKVTLNRNSLKPLLKAKIEESAKESLSSINEARKKRGKSELHLTGDNIKSIVKNKTRDFRIKMGTRKNSQWGGYKGIMDNVDWDKVENEIDNVKVYPEDVWESVK